MIARGIADDGVRQFVPRTVDRSGSRHGEFLDIGGEGVADRGLDQIVALVGILDHHVADIVDHVGVVAGTALESVGACLAVEGVVASHAIQVVAPGRAGDRIVLIIADAIEIIGADQRQLFDICGQDVAGAGGDGIRPFTGVFDDHIVRVVDHVLVVAGAAHHRIGAAAAIEHVGAAETIEHIVTGEA